MKYGVGIHMDNRVLKFELTVDEINWVLGALQEIPAKYCNPITNKLQQQAQPQLNPITGSEVVETEKND